MTQTQAIDTTQAVEKLSFEKASKLLDAIVNNLEDNTLDLDLAIEQYKFGCKLQQHCAKILEEAKLKIIAVKENKEGAIEQDSSASTTFDE